MGVPSLCCCVRQRPALCGAVHRNTGGVVVPRVPDKLTLAVLSDRPLVVRDPMLATSIQSQPHIRHRKRVDLV